MTTFTKWTIVLMINFLIVSLLFSFIISSSPIIGILIILLDVIICIPLWTFVHWNIKSDEDLGIKPNIEFI